MAAQQQHGVTVAQPPTDGITRVRWSPGGKLMATSWDQVRLVGHRQPQWLWRHDRRGVKTACRVDTCLADKVPAAAPELELLAGL